MDQMYQPQTLTFTLPPEGRMLVVGVNSSNRSISKSERVILMDYATAKRLEKLPGSDVAMVFMNGKLDSTVRERIRDLTEMSEEGRNVLRQFILVEDAAPLHRMLETYSFQVGGPIEFQLDRVLGVSSFSHSAVNGNSGASPQPAESIVSNGNNQAARPNRPAQTVEDLPPLDQLREMSLIDIARDLANLDATNMREESVRISMLIYDAGLTSITTDRLYAALLQARHKRNERQTLVLSLGQLAAASSTPDQLGVALQELRQAQDSALTRVTALAQQLLDENDSLRKANNLLHAHAAETKTLREQLEQYRSKEEDLLRVLGRSAAKADAVKAC